MISNKKKRGKWSISEDKIIREGIDLGKSADDILQDLVNNDPKGRSREIETLVRHINKLKRDQIVKATVEDSSDLRNVLQSKEYYPHLVRQFTTDEMRYFEAIWVELMQQFRHDVLPSEELQLKELITVDILATRTLTQEKLHLEETERLQKKLNLEYDLPVDQRDMNTIASLEQQIAQLRNSVASFTTEYSKLLDKKAALNKELKANRDVRIKRVEDSKSSWAGLIRALENETLRQKTGEGAELMRLAKDNAKKELSEWHTYVDGNVDQPLLTPETVRDDNEDDSDDDQSIE